MHTPPRPADDHSLASLLDGLRENFRNLLREELQLAKTEMAEKISFFGRNAVYLGIGAGAVFLGLVLLLVSLGFLLSYAFEAIGLSTGIALFLGFMVLAILLGAIGGGLLAKAVSAFSKESLIPVKTIETLKEIKAGGMDQSPIRTQTIKTPEIEDKRDSGQIRADIEKTRSEIHRDVKGVRNRLNFARVATEVVTQAKSNPVRTVGIGLGTTLAGFVILRIARLFGRKRAA